VKAEDVERLVSVVSSLGELIEESVIVGGAVLPLYLDPAHAHGVRVTLDVDIVHRASRWTERVRLDEQLRERGWLNVMLDAPICRWTTPARVLVDVLSPSEDAMGFTNPWFEPCWNDVQVVPLGDNLTMRILKVTSYLATKIAAFSQRGGNDWYSSKDIEDIVTVIAGRQTLPDDVLYSSSPARSSVIEWFRTLQALNSEAGGDIVRAHLDPELAASAEYAQKSESAIRQIASLV
jgi:hypothetical protein